MSCYRITLLIIFLAAGLSLVVVGTIRKTVDVDINVRVREVSFQASDERVARLFNSIATNSITVSKFQRIDLGDGLLRLPGENDGRGASSSTPRSASTVAQRTYLLPEEAFANLSLDSVTLNRLEVPRGARVSLSWDEAEPSSIKISFNVSASGEIAGGARVRFSCTACRFEHPIPKFEMALADMFLVSLRDGQIISFQGQNDSTIVALDLPPKTSLKERNISSIGNLDFSRFEDGRSVSSVLDGKIQFEGLDSPVAIGDGAYLHTDHLRNAVIKTIWIENGINLSVRGRTDALLMGGEGNLRNKTPTILQWIYAQHSWILIVQTLALVISIVLGVLSWAGVYREPKE